MNKFLLEMLWSKCESWVNHKMETIPVAPTESQLRDMLELAFLAGTKARDEL